MLDTEASFVVQLPPVLMLLGYCPHSLLPPPHPAALLHLVSVYHQEWDILFLQCTGQRCPDYGWVPSENRSGKSFSPCRLSPAVIHSRKFLFLLFTQSSGGNNAKLNQVVQIEFGNHPTNKLSYDKSVEMFIHSFIQSFLCIHSLQEFLPKCFLGRGEDQISVIFIVCHQGVCNLPREFVYIQH